MNLLDRFSTNLRDVLARAIHLATELKNPEVEPIHLLFAISNQKGALAAELINRFKIKPQILEQALVNLPACKENTTLSGTAQNTITPLSSISKMVLEKAMMMAQENQHNYIGTEHLLAALIKVEDKIINEVLVISEVKPTELMKNIEAVLANATHFPQIKEATEVARKIEENMDGMIGSDEPMLGMPKEMPNKKSRRRESALDFFATNLTNPEIQKNIDPVVGRETEIERSIQILCRRTKNNPLLLGEPGVGKTAIVEGLAKKIVTSDVPEMLLNKKIYSLDMGMLIAGTIYRGEFEGRLRQVIDEVVSNPNIILFIDEIHNIVGAGSNQGTMDAANILKPALSRGQIRCIGATTFNEYKKHIENDAALERRFQPIAVKEPSIEETIAVLRGVKSNYENYHRVKITNEAVEAAAKLADRYITSKFLPDKAIDLLDETAAAKRLSVKNSPKENKLRRWEQQLEKIIIAKEAAATNDKFEEAVNLKKEEEKLKAEIKKARTAAKEKKVAMVGEIGAREIALQVAKITGTPTADLLLSDSDGLKSLASKLREYVVGQDTVLEEVAQTIRQAKLGLSNPERPLASFLFVGESGVGKTELAKSLAKVLYQNSEAFIKLDMSEFNESFGVSKLLGSPAGYVGFKESNQFTDKIKMNPYCVILFDEIDKAHKDVRRLLLQMLENGTVNDSTGKKISLKHAIIILTTSLGSADLKRGTIGFDQKESDQMENRERLLEKMKEYFTPELINRLDNISLFTSLDKEQLIKIAALELDRFNKQLTKYQTAVTATEKVLEWLVTQLSEKNNGAREVRRNLRAQVEMLMSQIILGSKVKKKYFLEKVDNKLLVK